MVVITMKSECKECNKNFSSYSSLRRHVKTFHQQKANELAPSKKSSKEFKFKCEHCGRNFSHKNNLRFHQKTHGLVSTLTPAAKLRKCPLCDFKAESRFAGNFLEHFQKQHDISIESRKLSFPGIKEYEEWKEAIEKETKSKYVIYHKCVAKTKTQTTTKYVCHRSGYFVSESKGKRRLKMQGSNKINGFCPASITVVISSDGTHKVYYVKTHVGHQPEIERSPLTAAERQIIAEKIASKIPFSSILNEVRDSVTKTNLERIHLITRKDLHNIKSSFNLNLEKSAEDAPNLETFITEMQKAGSVLFYKNRETLNADCTFLKYEDFVLIIMTNSQKEMLSKYGADCVCIDRTHKVNGYGFEMHTLLVVDELGQGFPCACLISTRCNHEILLLYFSCIKEKVGLINSKVFMSDLADEYYYTWTETMSVPQSRLYCSWDIDYAWRNNLCTISSKEKQVEVHKKARALLEETDPFKFSQMVKELQDELNSDPETQLFLDYFKEYFLHKTQYWAYCYRTNSQLDINMHLESTHERLKSIYLHGKNITRLDRAIEAIIKFVGDKLLDLKKGRTTFRVQNVCSLSKSDSHTSQSSELRPNTVIEFNKDFLLVVGDENNLWVDSDDSVHNDQSNLKEPNGVDETQLDQATFCDRMNQIKLKFMGMLESATSLEHLASIENVIDLIPASINPCPNNQTK